MNVKKRQADRPQVGVIMGSQSDWNVMRWAADVLECLQISYEKRVISAHRTPDVAFQYARTAEKRGLQCIIAGAGAAAHLAGVMAGLTHLPVLGVPIRTKALDGLDSLLSIVQMPAGIPVATFPIGEEGAVNAALFAAQIVKPQLRTMRRKLNN
ncbi:MAG: 5-(carboxyamino)imidazole ribonucleotide mutase [Verrucomicrobiota bacterium]